MMVLYYVFLIKVLFTYGGVLSDQVYLTNVVIL